jgi:hypothetical protein
MGMGIAIRRQARPRFAFAETRPEAGTPQKTLKKQPRERDQGVRGAPLREPLKSRFCVEGELTLAGDVKSL